MTTSIEDVVEAICNQYPDPTELSSPRLTKLVFLVDWITAVRRGEQATSIGWVYNHYGPFVWDVMDAVRRNPSRFEIEAPRPFATRRWEYVRCKHGASPSLPPEVQLAIKDAIRASAGLPWAKFLELVYSTYPIKAQPKFSELNLKELARQHNQQREQLAAP